MTRLFWVRSRAVIVASALLAAGCQSNSDEMSDIGANPPPVEFQAACLRLPRGAVVSLTHKPTLGVVLRTISPKEGTSVRWERVSNSSYIQRMEWSDPLTGKAGESGMMFNKLATAPTPDCPNGEVLLARMVVNGEEAAPAVMNDAFLSLVNVAALNAPRPHVASAPPPEAAVPPQPDMPLPDPETGCYGDDCPVTGDQVPFDVQRRSNSLSPSQRAAVDRWRTENNVCRGSGDPVAMEVACEKREAIGPELTAAGLCYGHRDDRGGVDNVWHVCEAGSDR